LAGGFTVRQPPQVWCQIRDRIVVSGESSMVRESATQSYRAGEARDGFTLIELLAVIAIIGLLIGLLLPAVQSARESSRRSTCVGTLKQWGRAIQGYEQSYGILPLGVSEYRCDPHSWVPMLWPYIDQQTLADRYKWDGTAGNVTALTANPVGPMSQTLPNYYCPSDRANAREGNLPKVNYVVNATTLDVGGKKYYGPFNRTRQNGFMSYCSPRYPNLPTGPSLGWHRLVGPGYVGKYARRLSHVLDGLSNTLMMAEAITGGSDPRGRLDKAFFDARLTPNSAFDVIPWWWKSTGCQNIPPSLPCQATGGDEEFNFASRSRHVDGVQSLMCDGSVRFTSNSVNQAAWQAQGTMNRGDGVLSDE
jgi:prepilin-type N-terminal cleavage/methylation domain-containing protein